MFRILTCLTTEHDWRLVLLAGLVCFVASVVAVNIFHRAIASQTRTRLIWIAIAGAVFGYGIWATHFIAMLAYEPGVSTGYGLALTALSLAAAMILTSCGMGFAVSDFARWRAPIGGAIMGTGIASMHYLGMWALEVPGRVVWSLDLVVASIVLGLLFGYAALLIAIRRSDRWGVLLATLFLTLATVSHHFTAMGAVEIIPDPTRVPDTLSLSPAVLALAIAGVALSVLGMSFVGVLADHRLARVTHMAQHDVLTDLPNRVLFRDRLEQALFITRRGGPHLAVLMLDLDRFKEINDTLGHPTGDALLQAVATRLRMCTRNTALIARLGGDEFAVIEHMPDPVVEAAALAERIKQALSEPFDLGDHQVIIGTSIGIAVAPTDGVNSDQILKGADLALYRAKSGGRGTFHFFEPELDRHMHSRRNLERDMRSALVSGEFDLHYQPFVDLKSGALSGLEALLRWHHPQRGLVLPADFIPLSEETGLIVPIGEWVLQTACAEAAKWPADLKISVNLSPAQFRSKELVPVVISALATSGIAPHRLELEVTETAIMHGSEAVFAALGQLHELGVRIALDDFGTGYSSLSFLQKFPFDKIKIDSSFVNELFSTNDKSRLIALAVVRFAVSLGKTTTAKGVETEEQLDILREEACAEMQGYYFSRPKSSSEIAQMVQAEAMPATTTRTRKFAENGRRILREGMSVVG